MFHKDSSMGGDPTSVVFCAPLYGGFPDEWVTWLWGCEFANPFQQLTGK
jgi:hypothetical protein